MNKKSFVALIIALVFLSGSFGLGANAQSLGVITGLAAPINLNASHDTSVVNPGRVLYFPLTADIFLFEGMPGAPGGSVTPALLAQNNVTMGYETSHSQLVRSVTISTTAHQGSITSAVRVEFAENFHSLNSINFEISVYLSIAGTRIRSHEVTLSGRFENQEVTVIAGDNFADISGGRVLVANANISNLEVYIGDGVSLHTRVISGRRYRAVATVGLATNADFNLADEHEGLSSAVRIRTFGFVAEQTRMSLDGIGDYYVYSPDLEWLGRTSQRLDFRSLFYLSEERLDVQSAGRDSAGDEQPDEEPADTAPPDRPIFGDTPVQAAARVEMADAARAAIRAGASTARLYESDVQSISTGELQAMFEVAASARLMARYIVDTSFPGGEGVQGRIEINPALASRRDMDIYLGVYTQGINILEVSQFFGQQFENPVRVLYLTHEGGFGMPVQIAANLDITEMDIQNLRFFAFDRPGNILTSLRTPNSSVDSNGLLRFTTIYGGYIIVSQGALVIR